LSSKEAKNQTGKPAKEGTKFESGEKNFSTGLREVITIGITDFLDQAMQTHSFE